MSLKYACEILVRYLERFLRYRQMFIDPYIMEFYIKCCNVNINFLIDNAWNSYLNSWLMSLEISSRKSKIKICGLRHDKNGYVCK